MGNLLILQDKKVDTQIRHEGLNPVENKYLITQRRNFIKRLGIVLGIASYSPGLLLAKDCNQDNNSLTPDLLNLTPFDSPFLDEWFTTDASWELLHSKLDIAILDKLPAWKRLIFISNIPVEYLLHSEEVLLYYLLNYEVEIDFSRFKEIDIKTHSILLTNIVPDNIGSLSINWDLTLYRMWEYSGENGSQNFYNKLRPDGLDPLTDSGIENHFSWTSLIEAQKTSGKKVFYWDKINCIDLLSVMKKLDKLFIDESTLDNALLDCEHETLDRTLCARDESGKTIKITHGTRPIDIATLNVWLKRFINKLMSKFTLLVISSARRSCNNNNESKWALYSFHLNWTAVDFRTRKLNEKDSSEYLENVEAYLIACWYGEKLFISCHWKNYHLHINIKDTKSIWDDVIARFKKSTDLFIERNVFYYKPIVSQYWELLHRISKSDYDVIIRYGFSKDVLFMFFDSYHQWRLRKILRSINVKSISKAALWYSNVTGS